MSAPGSPWSAADAAMIAVTSAAAAERASEPPIAGRARDEAAGSHYMVGMTREEMDAKIDAATARNEAFEHRVDASFTRMEARIMHLPSTTAMLATAFTTAIAIVGVILGVIAFGGDRFDGGVQLTTASVQAATDAQALSKQNAQQIEYLTGRIDDVLKALAPRVAPPSQPPAP